MPASSLYAIAALDLGSSYINFTPSLGAAPAAIDELARLRGARHAGCDGKTGETLLKSVLAPMFAARNLQVMSWVGHNIFGNMDGRVLDDPANKRAKLESKDRLLGEILGYKPQTHISIEFIESLGDWKTAWDHIHFAGFLGTPMTFQFIWQGCDSVLAAPLVIDLIRFTELAQRRGQTGLLTFLASFFKSPLGVEEHSFVHQFQMLQQWLSEAKVPAVKDDRRSLRRARITSNHAARTHHTSHIVQRSKSRMTSQPAEERPESPQAAPMRPKVRLPRKRKRRRKSRKQSRPAATPAVELNDDLDFDDDEDDLELPSYGKRFDRGTKEDVAGRPAEDGEGRRLRSRRQLAAGQTGGAQNRRRNAR